MYRDNPVSDVQERPEPRFAPSRAASGPKDEISILDLLTVIAERKRTILWYSLTFALIALVVSLVWPSSYTASVALLTPQETSPLSSVLSAQFGSMGSMGALAGSSLGLKNPNEIYVAMLKSRTLEDAMVHRFGLMQEYHKRYLSDGRKALEKHASIDGSGKDTLIRISVEDHDPKRAAELANGYIDEFRHLSEHLAITEASQRRLFYEQQLVTAKNNLADAEQSLKTTEQTTGMLQLDSQTRALIESAASLRAQVVAKEVEIQSLRSFATTQNPQLLQAQQELDGLRAQLAKLGGSEAVTDSGLIMPKGKVPQAGLEYIRKLREVKYDETIFDILARQFEYAKLDEAREGPAIQVVDAATPPDKRSFPKRTLMVLTGAVIGLIMGILVALIQGKWLAKANDPMTREKLDALRKALSFRKASAS